MSGDTADCSALNGRGNPIDSANAGEPQDSVHFDIVDSIEEQAPADRLAQDARAHIGSNEIDCGQCGFNDSPDTGLIDPRPVRVQREQGLALGTLCCPSGEPRPQRRYCEWCDGDRSSTARRLRFDVQVGQSGIELQVI